MKTPNQYILIIREYKSVMLRFILLIFGLLLINFSHAQVGNACGDPIKILELPFAHSGNILTYGNDYDEFDVPPEINNPFSNTPYDPNFLNGPDVVYKYIPEVEGFIDVSFSANQNAASLWVFVDCPFGATIGWDYSSTNSEGEILDLPVFPGEAFYFVLSSNNPSANYSFSFEVKYALSGENCDAPIEINNLPYAHTDVIDSYGINYTGIDAPAPIGNPSSDTPFNINYLNGPEVVYRYVPVADGFVSTSLHADAGGSSIWVFTGCPFASTIGWDNPSSGFHRAILNIPVSQGVAYYFVVSSIFPNSTFSFDFEIHETFPGEGCNAPFEVSILPFSHSGETADYGNNYSYIDSPPAIENAIKDAIYNPNYINGSEVVYAYTPIADGFVVAGSITEQLYASISVFTGCPFESAIGWDYSPVEDVRLIVNIPVLAGQTYYFVLSSASSLINYSYSFFIEESQGLICEAPYNISGFTLPISISGDVPVYANDYNENDVPPALSDAIYNVPYNNFYLKGPEVVFAYTPTSNMYIDLTVSASEDYTSIWVFTGCPFQSAIGWDYSSAQEDSEIKNIPVTGGETYYIVLSGSQPSVGYSYSFTLKKSDGDVCESPLQVQSLPYSHQAEISNYGNDYSEANIPPSVPFPTHTSPKLSFLLNGYETVYTYTPTVDQLVDASVTGEGSYMGLWVFTGCPFELLHGWDMFITNDQVEIQDIPLLAGVEYYFVVSTRYETAFEYTFELKEFDCPILELDFNDPCFDGTYDTSGDHINEECECVGYFKTANIAVTIPQAASCGTRAVRVVCYVPNTDILIRSHSLPNYGSNTFSVINMPVGTVDIYIEVEGALRILLEDHTLSTGANNIEVSQLILGDLNDNNSINITDISLFAASFGSAPNGPNYNVIANLNCDSSINIIDLSLLGASFGMQGVSLP